mmetsp:Transcript_3894/g.8488  ORF Transcript_3894/g.8488 Transcript_3894/m.8488 type:complete len:1209 (-) Transcript_3894:136-3762(-)
MLRSRSFGSRTGGDHVEVAESLSALDRARLFASSKLCLQRLVFVHELVECAHEVGYEDTATYLLPLVRTLADDSEVLVRQMLVGQFGDLAGFLIQADPDQGYELVVKVLLPIVSLLLAEKHAEVRQGAAEAFVTLASHLRTGDRGDQVLRCVITLSHGNDDEEARSTAVQLLNALAETLGKPLCEQFIGIELTALAEDPQLRVRKATASNFAEVCRVVDDEWMLRKLFPAFQRLARDAHWSVRKAVVENLITVAMSIDVSHRAEVFVPLMNELIKDASRWVRIAALQQLGYLIAALERPEPEPRALLNQYVQIVEEMKANPDVADICYHCAFTFAAVTKASGIDAWRKYLHDPFVSLARDMQPKTRKAIAASVHIIMEVLGSELSETDVSPLFEELLQDTSEEVRLAALRNVPALLRLAPQAAPQRRVLRVVGAVLERSRAANWRLRHLLAELLPEICEELCSSTLPTSKASEAADGGDDVNATAEAGGKLSRVALPTPPHIEDLAWSVIVPLFMTLCSDTVAEVRHTAASATACVFRVVSPQLFAEASSGNDAEGSSGGYAGEANRSTLNADVLRLLFNFRTFALSGQFRNRQVYIRMCDAIVREAPLCLRVDILLRPLAALAADKVRNVRLLWASVMLPHVRKVGRLGNNHLLVQAACDLIQADPQSEVQRLMAGAELHDPASLEDVPDDSEAALDEACQANGWCAREGGTGDVGLAASDAEAVIARSPASTPPVQAEVDTCPPRSHSPDRRLSEPVETEGPLSPTPASSSTSSPPQPGASQQRGSSQAHDHDLVEDSLVEQSEVERSMTTAYMEHLLSGPPPRAMTSHPEEYDEARASAVSDGPLLGRSPDHTAPAESASETPAMETEENEESPVRPDGDSALHAETPEAAASTSAPAEDAVPESTSVDTLQSPAQDCAEASNSAALEEAAPSPEEASAIEVPQSAPADADVAQESSLAATPAEASVETDASPAAAVAAASEESSASSSVATAGEEERLDAVAAAPVEAEGTAAAAVVEEEAAVAASAVEASTEEDATVAAIAATSSSATPGGAEEEDASSSAPAAEAPPAAAEEATPAAAPAEAAEDDAAAAAAADEESSAAVPAGGAAAEEEPAASAPGAVEEEAAASAPAATEVAAEGDATSSTPPAPPAPREEATPTSAPEATDSRAADVEASDNVSEPMATSSPAGDSRGMPEAGVDEHR